MNAPVRKRLYRVPSNLSDAIQSCLDYALRKHNRSPKRLAELMGVKLDTLYKWLSEDRIPVNMIGSFEHSCGANYLTEYLCAQAHLLAVEMPRGRNVKAGDVMELQGQFSASVSLLISFYRGEADQDETVSSLYALLNQVAWHKANVERSVTPELALFDEDVQ